jgi:hypothetical protein
MRALSPNRIIGLKGHAFAKVLKEPVSPILPSKNFSFATH